MTPEELAQKIRGIRIASRKAVNDILAGEYVSVFKGRGMEFDEVRPYQPGDDVRTIDWNVTARTGHPYVKRYVEERELTVLFVVDLSASGAFGSTGRAKSEVAAELCALLAFSAIRNHDKVGLVVFTDRIELFIPARKGATHVLRLIRELLHFKPQGRKTDITMALDYVGRVQRRRGVVFLVSDFIAAGWERSLRILSHRHDLVAVSITDPREKELPAAGLFTIADAETGEMVLVDTGSAAVRRRYAEIQTQQAQRLAAELAASGVDHIPLEAGDDYVADLVRFFRAREARR